MPNFFYIRNRVIALSSVSLLTLLTICGIAIVGMGGQTVSAASAAATSTATEQATSGESVAPNIPPVRVISFIPADMQPFADREGRLGRVMTHVQEFFRKGMEAHGFGPKTFELEWDEPGKLRLYTIQGRRNQTEYGRNDWQVIRNEVRAAMQAQHGIEINNEFVVIFQSLLRWENGRATELGPYVGGGNHLSGTAWVYDDPLLDAANLASREPGGYYHRPVSIGQFNTHYIGGVAHELGHAFGVPHDRETDEQRRTLGTSLMGSGNHTYGEELRSQGLGTFLSAASALQLSTVRAFVGNLPGSRDRAAWRIDSLETAYQDEKITFTGRYTAVPPLVGIIAFNDDLNIPGDFDSKAWVVKTDGSGHFSIEIGDLVETDYQLRFVAVHQSGQKSRTDFHYSVSAAGPDLSPFASALLIEDIRQAFLANNRERLDSIVADITARYPNSELQQRAQHLSNLLRGHDLIDLLTQPADVTQVDLTWARWFSASTGWGHARRGSVPESVFLEVGSRFFASGLYAHAPSSHVFHLGNHWTTFKSSYGLQDGNPGSVVFVVRGDDRELFRSSLIINHRLRQLEVDVTGVQRLELIVEDGGNGNSSDWGVWIKPMLER